MGNHFCTEPGTETTKPGVLEEEEEDASFTLLKHRRKTWHGSKRESQHSQQSQREESSQTVHEEQQHGQGHLPSSRSRRRFRTTWHGSRRPRSSSHADTFSSSHHHQHQQHHHHHRPSLKSVRHKSVKMAHATGHVVGHWFQALEEFFFPKIATYDTSNTTSKVNTPRVRGGVLLEGCTNAEEHYAKVQECLAKTRQLHSVEGLLALGLEYRILQCHVHTSNHQLLEQVETPTNNQRQQQHDDNDTNDSNNTNNHGEPQIQETSPGADNVNQSEPNTSDDENDDDHDATGGELAFWSAKMKQSQASNRFSQNAERQEVLSSFNEPGLFATDVTESLRSNVASSQTNFSVRLSMADTEQANMDWAPFCHLCMRRLYHIDSNTLLTVDNRKQYIADGDMYEEVARLCQEYAHDLMCEEGGLEWVTIEEAPPEETDADGKACDSPKKEPIRALVNSNHPLLVGPSSEMANRPTILIATGRGKVRAGIFSRQHLICSGLESATAVPIVREALQRRLNIVIVDPNVHGDHMGFVTFEKTMNYVSSLLHGESQDDSESPVPLAAKDLYVLSHSASGGHFARYLLNKSETYLPHIRAIAFTDSTHNIQWAKTNGNPELYQMLESNKCVYFRCSKVRQEDDSQWYLHSAGEEVQTDSFWQHRFGKIKTYWAGTNEHSLTNWHAHHKIWEHFDEYLKGGTATNETGTHNAVEPTKKSGPGHAHRYSAGEVIQL